MNYFRLVFILIAKAHATPGAVKIIYEQVQKCSSVVPILAVRWTIANIFMIIIPQISEEIDHNMPLLGDCRSYMLCYPRYQWSRQIAPSHYCVVPILTVW